MPIYKITGNTSDDATIYVIDEATDELERYGFFPAGNYELTYLSQGSKLVVATVSGGPSLAYGGISPVESAGDPASTGNDGELVVSSAGVEINDYTNITSVGVNNITVNSAAAFAADDEVMIVQSQSTGSSVGTWETKRILSINSNIITFTDIIENSYSTSGSDVLQAVRIPNYTDVTVNEGASITCPGWNGSTGGIIFFRASGTTILAGSVTAYKKGFRQGPGRTGNTNRYGWSGESTLPNSYATTAAWNSILLGGGGAGWCGTASQYTPSGGAGGGHATAGANGRKNGAPQYAGTNGEGGGTYGVANLGKIYFGSAAGNSYGNGGGHGGGIIIISSETLTIEATGSINANGGYGADGYAGSAAGGSVFLQATVLDINTNLVSAAGGTQTTYGGAGGDGRIRLDYTEITGSTNNPTPGYTGSY
jgi:hypothetical protein